MTSKIQSAPTNMTAGDPSNFVTAEQTADRPRLHLTADEAALVESFALLHRLETDGDTVFSVRIALRDRLIRRAVAAVGIEAEHPWKAGKAIAERVRTFLARRWPCWRNLPAPPAGADELDQAFFNCMRMGAEPPESSKTYFNLVAAKNDDEISEAGR